jgi:hypothetical protein
LLDRVLAQDRKESATAAMTRGGHAALLRDNYPGTWGLRFTVDQRRRLAAKGKALGHRLLQDVTSLVAPDTISRWYRQLIADKYDGSRKRRPGRRTPPHELRQLVARFARDSPTWGYTRLRGALQNLGRGGILKYDHRGAA